MIETLILEEPAARERFSAIENSGPRSRIEISAGLQRFCNGLSEIRDNP